MNGFLDIEEVTKYLQKSGVTMKQSRDYFDQLIFDHPEWELE